MEYRLKTVDVHGDAVKEMPEYYTDTAYIIVAAFKCDETEHLEGNKELTEKLQAKIRKSGYFHTPIWGNFHGETNDATFKEQAFIVFNFKGMNDERLEDSLELRNLGERLCKLFAQEAYFYKEEGPSKKGDFVDANGEVIMTSYEIRPLQAADVYFNLVNEKARKGVQKQNRLTYVEGKIYTSRRPMTPNGDRVAMRKHETYILSN